MPTSEGYFIFIKEQLSQIEDISFKKMMGEYLLYYKGKYIAAICDDRLLIKPFEDIENYLPSMNYQKPYDGAKDMILVDIVDDPEGYRNLFEAAYLMLTEARPRGGKDKKERT